MASFLRPLFLRFLLLCVVLNLGDAPYVDELMAEMGQDLVVSAQVLGEVAPAKPLKESAGQDKPKHSIYEELVALVAMPTPEQPAMRFVEPSPEDLRATASWPSLPGPASSIEKPPRFAATA